MERGGLAAAVSRATGTLVEVLGRCCVQVTGSSRGSGFFVAPRKVLTCAHVIGATRRPGLIRGVHVRWGTALRKQVRLLGILPADDEDLALLEVAFDGHPCVALDTDVRQDDALYAAGFPDHGAGPQQDGVRAWFEARTFSPFPRHSRYLLKVRSGHVVNGFSGGPLLNIRTAAVVGVMTETRGTTAALGGWAVPIELGVGSFPGLAAESASFHESDERWRAAAQDVLVSPGGTRPPPLAAEDTFPLARRIRNFAETLTGSPDAPEPFGGRDRELARLTAWGLHDDAPPYLLLTAPAGRGKSALLAHWVRTLREPPADGPLDLRVVYVPISIRYETSTVRATFSALATRLRHALGLPATVPPDLGWADAAADALARDAPEGTRVVVVVDGLDEATGWRPGPGTFPLAPGRGLRVLVAARATAQRPDERAWREALGWDRPNATAVMALGPLDERGVAEVLHSAAAEFVPRDAELVRQVHRLTGGDPIVVRLYAKELASGGGGARMRPEALARLETGLGGFFDWWWRDQEAQWGEQFGVKGAAVGTVFNVLATALGPLDRRDLLGLLARGPVPVDGDQLDAAVAVLDRFVTRVGPSGAYVLAHPRFAAYRFEKLRADGRQRTYERLFVEWGEEVLRDRTDGVSVPRYLVQFLGAHLERAGAPPEGLEPLSTDAWRTAWEVVAEDEGGFFADVDRVAQAARGADRRLVAAGEPPRHLALQYRCALDHAAGRTRAVLLEPEVAGLLVRHEIWSVRRALAFARRLDAAGAAARALSAIAPALGADGLPPALAFLDTLTTSEPEDHAIGLGAVAARLLELGRVPEAQDLVARSPHPYARADARITLATRLDEQARRAVIQSILEDAALVDIRLRLRLVGRLTRALPGAVALSRDGRWTDDLHVEAAGCRCWLCVASGLVADRNAVAPHLPSALPPRDLEEVAGWIPEPLRAALARRALEAERAAGNHVGLSYTIRDLAPFLDGGVRALAWSLCDTIVYEGHAAVARGALFASTPAEDRRRWTTVVLAGIGPGGEISSISARREFFADMVRAGLGEPVLARILELDPNSWWAGEAIAAVAPEIGEPQVRRLLARLPALRRDVRDPAASALLGRLASFGRLQAAEALAMALRATAGHEHAVAQASLRVQLNNRPASDRWVEAMQAVHGIDGPDERETLVRLAACTLREVPAAVLLDAVLALRDDAGMEHSARSLEILGALAPRLRADAAIADATLRALRLVTTSVAHPHKERFIARYFARLGALGLASQGLSLARDLASSTWQRPLVWGLLAMAEWLEEGSVTHARDILARLDPDDVHDHAWRVAARGVVVVRFGRPDEVEDWRAAVVALEPYDVQERSDAIAMMLDALPDEHRQWAAATLLGPAYLLPPVTFLPDNQVDPYADLAPHLPEREVQRLLEWLGELRSGSARRLLVAALVPRLVALGRSGEAFVLAQRHGLDVDAARNVWTTGGDADLDGAFEALGRMPARDRYRVGPDAAERLVALPAPRVLEFVERWMERLGSGTRPEALLETTGVAPLVHALGGDAAVSALLAEIGA